MSSEAKSIAPLQFIRKHFLNGSVARWWCNAALETLGDVVGNRKGRALKLVPESGMRPEDIESGELVHHASELYCFLPDRQVFSACTAWLLSCFAASQISDFKSHMTDRMVRDSKILEICNLKSDGHAA